MLSVLSGLTELSVVLCECEAMAEFEKGIPRLGLRFKTPDDAWQFWLAYGGQTGFDVRKRYTNLRKFDGQKTSCRFVC